MGQQVFQPIFSYGTKKLDKKKKLWENEFRFPVKGNGRSLKVAIYGQGIVTGLVLTLRRM